MQCFSNENCKLEIPEQLKPWIFSKSSLTKQLKRHIKATEVAVVNQCWMDASWWEHYLLPNVSGRTFIREINMMSPMGRCWYARTVVPEESYQFNSSFFAKLATLSLGDLLFNHADVKRISLSYYPVTKEDIEFHWVKQSGHLITEQPLWARRCAFEIYGKPLYLLEVFLPNFIDQLCEHSSLI